MNQLIDRTKMQAVYLSSKKTGDHLPQNSSKEAVVLGLQIAH